MKNIVFVIVPIFGLVLVAACGGGSSGGGAAEMPSITMISELPRATSPMASSSSAQVAKDFGKAATTGMNLATTASSSFNSSSSRGACETLTQVKNAVQGAAQADMILCFVAQMNSSFQGLTDASGNAINIYDGLWHIFNLDVIAAEGYSPDRVKMRIVKDAAGSITSFEMFMCVDTGEGTTQNEYTSQTISGTNFTMRAVGLHSDAGGGGWHSVDVTGVLNADNVFTSKGITIKDSGSWGGEGNSNSQEGTLTQTPGAFTFSGFQDGSWASSSASGTYTNLAYGLGQMLGDTSTDILQLAMGDGAVKFGSDGTYDDGQGNQDNYQNSGNEAWNGDTGLPVGTNDYLAAATAGTLPTAATVSIGFASGETWPCTDDVGVGIVDLPPIQESVLQAACSSYSFGDHTWINCHDIIGEEQQ